MTLHRNARTTRASRLLIVTRAEFEDWPQAKTAEAAGVGRGPWRSWCGGFARAAGRRWRTHRPAPECRPRDLGRGGAPDSLAPGAAWTAGLGLPRRPCRCRRDLCAARVRHNLTPAVPPRTYGRLSVSSRRSCARGPRRAVSDLGRATAPAAPLPGLLQSAPAAY